jgi:UDP-N-acetylglucosamine 4,6-dehydratase
VSSILITGGTGSYGHAFVRHLLASADCPRRICILSRDEYKQHLMRETFRDDRLRFFLGDVRDVDRLELAFRGVSQVVHAAALKQVPAGEYAPDEFIKTNVLGSANVLEAARRAKVEKVLLLSTDKACAPVTLYGATKLTAERLFSAANSLGGPISACTRYGNIIDSRGSVIPVWRQALQEGREIQVTDPEATRFHMRQEQAVQLVLLALREMRGGEVFIPKLRSYRLRDLVRVVTGTDGVTVGLRPAEKVHELLISRDEARNTFEYADHYRIFPEIHPWAGERAIYGKAVTWSEYGSDGFAMPAEELAEAVA